MTEVSHPTHVDHYFMGVLPSDAEIGTQVSTADGCTMTLSRVEPSKRCESCGNVESERRIWTFSCSSEGA